MAVSDWYEHRLRARYAETDQMGVIYHANYFNWFEIGRTEMIRELGIPYRSLEESGLLLPVVDLDAKFIKPAYYDDQICIRTRITDASQIRISFEVHIVREATEEENEQLLVTGHTKHVWLNRSWKPVRIDREAPELYALLMSACGR